MHVLEGLRASRDRDSWVVVATAHPAKFEGIVEPLIGEQIPIPPSLAELLARPTYADPLANDYAALRAVLASD